MSSLFDSSWPSTNTNPPDTEAFRLGAQRIRETRDAVEAFLSKIFNDDSTFKTNVIPGASLTNASVTDAQLAANCATITKIPDGVFTADAAGRAKFADNLVTAAKLAEAARGDCHQLATAAVAFAGGAYAVTLSPAPTAYTDGMVVRFVTAGVNGTNTGAGNLNVNALGNKPIKRADGGALFAGDIQNGTLVAVVYSSTLNCFTLTYAPASSFTSNGFAPAVGVVADVAHGISPIPNSVQWVLFCIATDLGYAVNDEVIMDGGAVIDRASGNSAVVQGFNSTNMFVSMTDATPKIRTKTGGAFAAIASGKWLVLGRARL